MAKTCNPTTLSNTNKGAASAKSRKSQRQINAESAARKKAKERDVLDAVNTLLTQLNRPTITMKLHREPCTFKGKKCPKHVSRGGGGGGVIQ